MTPSAPLSPSRIVNWTILCLVLLACLDCLSGRMSGGKAEEEIVVNFNVYQIPSEAEISAGGNPGVKPTCSPWVGGMQEAGLELKIKQGGPLLSSPALSSWSITTKPTQ